MEPTQYLFERYEKKFFLTPEQYEAILPEIEKNMARDEYWRSTVYSLYYDTGDYALIRNSIESPVYKEKVRIRSYEPPQPDSPVFLELKKKARGKVYKRRVSMPFGQAVEYLAGSYHPPDEAQELQEFAVVRSRYALEPKVCMIYDRLSYLSDEPQNFRLTIDGNVRWGYADSAGRYLGDAGRLLADGRMLLEAKTDEVIPLWLARAFSKLNIVPATYSKYGTIYQYNLIQDFLKNGVKSNV